MGKLLRDKSGRRFLSCSQLKDNKGFYEAPDEPEMPPGLTDKKVSGADKKAAADQAKREEAQAKAKKEAEEGKQAPPKKVSKPPESAVQAAKPAAPKAAEQKQSTAKPE